MFTRPSNKASDIITWKALFLTLFLNSLYKNVAYLLEKITCKSEAVHHITTKKK